MRDLERERIAVQCECLNWQDQMQWPHRWMKAEIQAVTEAKECFGRWRVQLGEECRQEMQGIANAATGTVNCNAEIFDREACPLKSATEWGAKEAGFRDLAARFSDRQANESHEMERRELQGRSAAVAGRRKDISQVNRGDRAARVAAH